MERRRPWQQEREAVCADRARRWTNTANRITIRGTRSNEGVQEAKKNSNRNLNVCRADHRAAGSLGQGLEKVMAKMGARTRHQMPIVMMSSRQRQTQEVRRHTKPHQAEHHQGRGPHSSSRRTTSSSPEAKKIRMAAVVMAKPRPPGPPAIQKRISQYPLRQNRRRRRI